MYGITRWLTEEAVLKPTEGSHFREESHQLVSILIAGSLPRLQKWSARSPRSDTVLGLRSEDAAIFASRALRDLAWLPTGAQGVIFVIFEPWRPSPAMSPF
jgi:hypothetical protein